jgi:ribulose 1,5-bisphosphate carboxylase large subunit-like protein
MAEGASAAVRKGIDLVKDDDILAFIRAYVA